LNTQSSRGRRAAAAPFVAVAAGNSPHAVAYRRARAMPHGGARGLQPEHYRKLWRGVSREANIGKLDSSGEDESCTGGPSTFSFRSWLSHYWLSAFQPMR